MENKKQFKKEYNEPKLVLNCSVADVLFASEDAFGAYNMGWFEEE